MIPVPSGVRVWIAAGHTDMRCGMNTLALRIQQGLQRDPHAGDLFVFRGKSGRLIKIFWHDGLGASLYAKRLEKGRFVWPSTADGVVVITPGQLSTCSRESTGDIPSTPGGPASPAEPCGDLTHPVDLFARATPAVIHSSAWPQRSSPRRTM